MNFLHVEVDKILLTSWGWLELMRKLMNKIIDFYSTKWSWKTSNSITKSNMEFHFHIKLKSISNKIYFIFLQNSKAPLLPWNTPFSTTYYSLGSSKWCDMDISVICGSREPKGVSISIWSPFGPLCFHRFTLFGEKRRRVLWKTKEN